MKKKYQNGSRYNVEVKYDLHPKITKTLEELWRYTYVDKDGIRKFKPIFHALVLALHTDRHIKEGLFDHIRITDLNKIKADWNKVIKLAKRINNTGLAEQPVIRIYNLLNNPNESGYTREELLYPPEKRLFVDEMTKKLLHGDLLEEYIKTITKPDLTVSWEAGYEYPIVVARRKK